MFQVFRVLTRRDQENKHFIAARLSAQLTTKRETALTRQHPIQNEEWERLAPQHLFGFFRAADANNLVAAPLDQPLQASAALLIVFNE